MLRRSAVTFSPLFPGCQTNRLNVRWRQPNNRAEGDGLVLDYTLEQTHTIMRLS
ncbi:hypothetical protein SAMN05216332_101212 [Nitrosospira briensis]|nr:hypothetical protein SAMN05216332_101212 [Nitrosospira briensis]